MVHRVSDHYHTTACVYARAQQDNTITGHWSFIVKEHVQCLCEGGRSCTKENPAWQKVGNAIPGLHCSWVTSSVLAMARPWQENVLKFSLAERFKEENIGMILNLQEVSSGVAPTGNVLGVQVQRLNLQLLCSESSALYVDCLCGCARAYTVC